MRRETGRYCRHCRRPTLHAREVFSEGLGCFLTIITCGLFAPIWILAAVEEVFTRPWRCQRCGSARFPWGGALAVWSVLVVVGFGGWLVYTGRILTDWKPFASEPPQVAATAPAPREAAPAGTDCGSICLTFTSPP